MTLFQPSTRGFGSTFLTSVMTLLKSKSILLITHLPELARNAEEVIVLEKGVVKIRGTYDELSALGYIKATTKRSVDDITENQTEDNGQPKKGSEDEEIEAEVAEGATARISLGLIWSFFRMGNSIPGISLLLIIFILNQVVVSFSDLYLQVWTSHEENVETRQETKSRDILIYSISMIPSLLIPFLLCWAHFVACLRNVTKLHSAFIRAVTDAPMRFFETNSMGRILNRISKDMGSADRDVPQFLYSVFRVTNYYD